MFHDTANGKSTRISNFTAALEHKHVDSSVNNVTVGVPPFGNVTIKWSFGQHNIERIVMALNSASKVIGRFQNGEYRCYKGGFLTETECQEHYSLTVNASGDIIIAMRNISHPYFGSYLISVYRGLDDKIVTLWIIVCKKGETEQWNSSGMFHDTDNDSTDAHQHDMDQCVSKEHIYVKEGESALMVWGRTSGGEELRGNRLVVNSQVIAYLPRNSLNMSCSPFIKNSSLEELCHKRLEFFSNTTTILVKLRNLSSDEHWNFTLTHVLGSSSPCNPQDIKIVRVIIPFPVLLSTVSAVANNTVRTPISVILSSISTTVASTSSRVQNTIRPPTTETAVSVRPTSPSVNITFPSASLTTSVVPSVVNAVSPDGQGKSDDPPTIGNGALVVFIVLFIVTFVLRVGIIAFSLWRNLQ